MKKLLFIVLVAMQSCIVVKYHKQEEVAPKQLILSPKPAIEMSETIVRSENGDMIAFLPKGWFFVNLGDESSKDIFAVAVNPDYTLSAIFSKMSNVSEVDVAAGNLNYPELAKKSITNQQAKSPSRVSQIGSTNTIEIGNSKFISYQMTTTAGALVSNVACFYSSLGKPYRFAIMPMDIIGKPVPAQKEANNYFESILTTIKY